MTIREYLKGRSKRARGVLALGAIVGAVALALAAMTSNSSSQYSAVLLSAAVLGVAIVFGALLYLDLTKCPSCRQRLGFQIANQYRLTPRVNFCPFCGASFDKSEIRTP